MHSRFTASERWERPSYILKPTSAPSNSWSRLFLSAWSRRIRIGSRVAHPFYPGLEPVLAPLREYSLLILSFSLFHLATKPSRKKKIGRFLIWNRLPRKKRHFPYFYSALHVKIDAGILWRERWHIYLARGLRTVLGRNSVGWKIAAGKRETEASVIFSFFLSADEYVLIEILSLRVHSTNCNKRYYILYSCDILLS